MQISEWASHDTIVATWDSLPVAAGGRSNLVSPPPPGPLRDLWDRVKQSTPPGLELLRIELSERMMFVHEAMPVYRLRFGAGAAQAVVWADVRIVWTEKGWAVNQGPADGYAFSGPHLADVLGQVQAQAVRHGYIFGDLKACARADWLCPPLPALPAPAAQKSRA